MAFAATVIRSQVPSYQEAGVEAALLKEGLTYQSAAFAYSEHSDGHVYSYFFPTLFFRGPDLPALAFVMHKSGGFELVDADSALTMGSARDFAALSFESDDLARFVVVDHGHEYTGSADEWPFGHVWLATESRQGFDFTQLSSFRAFNHSVDTGDLNGNGREDILVSNMGEKEGGYLINLNLYLQQEDGSFALMDAESSAPFSESGSGAAAIGDVTGDGNNEIVQANYGLQPADWGALRVFTHDERDGFQVKDTLEREGLFTSMGASSIKLSDLNGNGSLDIVLAMEGAYPGDALGAYTGAGLEIFENNGVGGFTRVTEHRLEKSVWRDELPFRDMEVLDINGDGLPDIVMNPDSGFGNASGFSPGASLSDYLLINDGQGGFVTPSQDAIDMFGEESLQDILFLRVMGSQGGETDFFGMTAEGAPVHVALRAQLAEAHLAAQSVTLQEASEFVYYHLNDPLHIVGVSAEYGVTNSMLAEIHGHGVTRRAVVEFFEQQGIDSLPLDNPSLESPPHGALADNVSGIALNEFEWLL